MSRSTCRRGFSIVELLVVIAIIAVLIGLLTPAVRRVREPAARSQCLNNLKQLGLAFHAYHDTYHQFPKGCVGPNTSVEHRLSWMISVLPYIEQAALSQKIDVAKGYE